MTDSRGSKECTVCGAIVPSGNVFCGVCGARWSTQESHSEDRLVGQVVDGRFRIESCLATGGMGAVYRAEHVGIGKKVAVKFLRADLRGQPALAQRLQREAMAVSKLRDVHTITVFDFGVWQGLAYLVMEFLEGQDLAGLLKEQQHIDVKKALVIARQICASLIEAHELGVIHRDLKPENVFLIRSRSGDELVKVLDFGLAKLLDMDIGDGRFHTADGAILGTPCYMAPEQVTGEDVGPQADLYALGALMYRMVTGYLPFTGRSPVEVFAAQRKGQPKPFKDVNPELHAPEYEALVLALLSRNPSERPVSAIVVSDALKSMQTPPLSESGSTTLDAMAGPDSGSWDTQILRPESVDDANEVPDHSDVESEWYSMTRDDADSGTWGFQNDGKDWELDGSFATHFLLNEEPDSPGAEIGGQRPPDPLVRRLKWARRFKFFFAFLTVCALIGLGWWVYSNQAHPSEESEPNDSASDADDIYFGHPMRGYIGQRNISDQRSDADHYRLKLESSEYVDITLKGVPRMDLVIDVSFPEPTTRSDQRPQLSDPQTFDRGGAGEPEHHVAGPFPSSMIYLTVREKWDQNVDPTENSTDAYELLIRPSSGPATGHVDVTGRDAGPMPASEAGKPPSSPKP